MTTRTSGVAKGDAQHPVHGSDNPAPEAGMSRDTINIGLQMFRTGIRRYSEEEQEKLEWLWGYTFDILGNSKTELARAIGYDYRFVYDVFTGAFDGPLDTFIAAIENLKSRAAQKMPLVETVVTRRITETLDYARDAAARNLCVDFIRRDWTSIPAGYCVIGDSRTFDTRVRVWDEKTQKWQARRPTVAALIDARSWFFAAYWITTDPVNADTLINTLGLYCCNTDGQPPAVAYFDNGKDYCAQGFSTPFEVDGHEHSIFQELGIRLQNATPYNGRAKTVERAFRDMMQQFDKMFPDYLGSTPAGRSAASDWFDDHAEELPSLEQFCTLFDEYISSYHNTPKKVRYTQENPPLSSGRNGSSAPQ